MIYLKQFSKLLSLTRKSVIFELAVFIFAVLGPWLWIKYHTKSEENRCFLSAKHEVSNWHFFPIKLGVQTEKSLTATDVINGHFINSQSNRVSVFAANWGAGQGDFTSVSHTPEKCWVGAGFCLVPHVGPTRITILIGGQLMPFQCRVFEHSDLATPEITIWAACIDGNWDKIPYEVKLEQEPKHHSIGQKTLRWWKTNINHWTVVYQLLISRANPQARKQFIRISAPLTSDWQSTLVELTAFANQWLKPE